jgi:hypothetical protein
LRAVPIAAILPATTAALAAFIAPRLSFDRALEDDLFFDFDDILDFLDLFGLTPARFEDDLDLARLAVFFMMIPPGHWSRPCHEVAHLSLRCQAHRPGLRSATMLARGSVKTESSEGFRLA